LSVDWPAATRDVFRGIVAVIGFCRHRARKIEIGVVGQIDRRRAIRLRAVDPSVSGLGV
jgi:hypothetical protein